MTGGDGCLELLTLAGHRLCSRHATHVRACIHVPIDLRICRSSCLLCRCVFIIVDHGCALSACGTHAADVPGVGCIHIPTNRGTGVVLVCCLDVFRTPDFGCVFTMWRVSQLVIGV